MTFDDALSDRIHDQSAGWYREAFHKGAEWARTWLAQDQQEERPIEQEEPVTPASEEAGLQDFDALDIGDRFVINRVIYQKMSATRAEVMITGRSIYPGDRTMVRPVTQDFAPPLR